MSSPNLAVQPFFKEYMPHISVDCVVFGFDARGLKVLLLKMQHCDEWALPGGFVRIEEPLESAATRVLHERTGLDEVFLQQFRVFSEPARSKGHQWNFDHEPLHAWLNQRFVTIGFYALVPFDKVTPQPDSISDACTWWNLPEVGKLILDHNAILHSALEALRLQMRYQPIGYNLLPEKFTMPELQKLYETVLGRSLDRRNFQRRMLDFGLLEKLPERKTGVAHKAPYFYRFNKAQYEKALQEGLAGEW